MYILIDTNILISLILEERQEAFLTQLETLVELNIIKLLVPQTLSDEWKLKSSQTVKNRKGIIIDLNTLSGGDPLLSDIIDQMETKVVRIDELLKRGIQINSNRKVWAIVIDRLENRQPPLHGEKMNVRDALIFFSSTYYLLKIQSTEFCFITNNGTDFGNNGGKSTDINEKLKDSKLKCFYYTNMGRFFQEKKTTFHKYLQKNEQEDFPFNPIRVIITTEQNILDYLTLVLKKIKEIMRFIPPEILSRIHPFRIENIHDRYTYYSNHVLYTNNSDLVNLFENIDTQNLCFLEKSEYRNSPENLKRLKEILSELNRQKIFKIDHVKGNKEININIAGTSPQFRITTYWLTFNWNKLLNEIHFSKNHSLPSIQVLFHLGYLNKAFDIAYSGYIQAKKRKDKFEAFAYLVKLKQIQVYFAPSLVSDEIRNIDLNKEFLRFTRGSRIEFELVKFLNNQDIGYYLELVRDLKDQIQESLDMHIRGGYSRNSFVDNLLKLFDTFRSYTLENTQLYLRFSEFSKLMNHYIEGVFLGLSLMRYNTSKLNHLNSDIVRYIILWGETDKLEKILKQYIKKEIAFETDLNFESELINHFKISDKVIKLIFYGDNYYLRSEYCRVTTNIVLLVSMLEMPKDFIAKLFKALGRVLELLLASNEIGRLKYFGNLFYKKGKYLDKNSLKNFLFLAIKKDNTHDFNLINGICSIGVEDGYISSLKDYQTLLDFLFSPCKNCIVHYDYIENIYRMFSSRVSFPKNSTF